MTNTSQQGLAQYLSLATSSFTDFVGQIRPELLASRFETNDKSFPHGTTIVAATFSNGVIIAGDRRATIGNMIAQRDIEKVFPADEFSVIGIAGVAGIAIELVRLFQVELEHFEKIEGLPLSLDGKANRLATMIRGNLSLAMQGLAVIPLFAGWDGAKETGRIFSYDGTGGRYEEFGFASVGSGSVFAKSALKKLYREQLDENNLAAVLIEALFDAADDDTGTGGPDLTRKIFPVLISVGPDGVRKFTENEVGELTHQVVNRRMQRADGPLAGLE